MQFPLLARPGLAARAATAAALALAIALPATAAAQVTVSIRPPEGDQASPVTVVVYACDDNSLIDHANAEFSFQGAPVDMGRGEPADTCTGWRWSKELTLQAGTNPFEANICAEDGSCAFPGTGWTCTNCFDEEVAANGELSASMTGSGTFVEQPAVKRRPARAANGTVLP